MEHLDDADFTLEADPNDVATREAVAAIYDRRADIETPLMAVNLMNSAAAYARAGQPYA